MTIAGRLSPRYRQFSSTTKDSEDATKRILSSHCFYKTLGVKDHCSEVEIKSSYRNLTKAYHPDVSKVSNAKEVYVKVVEAYTVLINKDTRARYDSSRMNQESWSPRDMDEKAYQTFKERQREEQNRHYSYWQANSDTSYSEHVHRKYHPGSFNESYQETPNQKKFPSILVFGSCSFVCGIFLYYLEERKQSKLEKELNQKTGIFGLKNGSTEISGASVVVNAFSSDGLFGDSPTVRRARFNQLAEEFEKKKITIEVIPNRLHPRYQKLLKDPEHIRQINQMLGQGKAGFTIVKSDSVLKMDSLKKKITLQEHYSLFHNGVSPHNSFDDIETQEREVRWDETKNKAARSKTRQPTEDSYI